MGISHLPFDEISPLKSKEQSEVSTTKRAFYLLKLAPSNLISHSKSSDLSVNNLYIKLFYYKYKVVIKT